MKNFQKKAFSLVELMVVIALIGIIILGMNSLNFNLISNKQKAEIFANKIVTEIETVRDMALVGKMIKHTDGKLVVPEEWRIILYKENNPSTVPSNELKIEYKKNINDTDVFLYKKMNIQSGESIKKFDPTCAWSNQDLKMYFRKEKVIIELNKCGNKDKIFTQYKNIDGPTIILNGISGLITTEKPTP